MAYPLAWRGRMSRAAGAESKAETKHRSRLPKLAWWGLGTIFTLLVLLVIASFLIDEPLRRRMESQLNQQLQGYTVRLPGLDLHPIGLSLTLEDLTIRQKQHPEPPVAHFPRLEASVQWDALLHLALVADFVFVRPAIHVNYAQMNAEAEDEQDVENKGWQQALEEIYPLEINEFRIDNGSFTYIDDPKRPMKLTRVNLLAQNIRNIRSPDRVYPSDVHLDATVFDEGKLVLDGHANFMAEPYAGVDVDIDLEGVELEKVKPAAARANLWISGGVLGAKGHVEYAPRARDIHLERATIDGIRVDYVHSAKTAAAEAERASEVRDTAAEINANDDTSVRIDEIKVRDSTVAYVDRTRDYRVQLSAVNASAAGYHNRDSDAPLAVSVEALLMDSGRTSARARFHPRSETPNFEGQLEIAETQLPALNPVFSSHGNFDFTSGVFSFYSEMTVRDGTINGYVKPIFSDVEVYDRRQDSDEPLLHQAYERLVGGLSFLLRNPREDVGTEIDISGTLDNPEISTLEVILGLVENAFFKAVVPGLERHVGRSITAASESAGEQHHQDD